MKNRTEVVKKLEREAYKLEVEQGRNQTYDLKPARMYEEAAHKWEDLGDKDRARGDYLHALQVARKAHSRNPTDESGRKIKELDKHVPRIVGHAWIILAVLGFVAGVFFLQSNITGNAIADLSTNTSSWVGGVLLVVGLIAGFFWMKRKKIRT